MLEDASLRTSEQRIIKKILNFNFGHKIVESSKKLAKLNSVCMSFTENSFINIDGRALTHDIVPLGSFLNFISEEQKMKLGLELRK